MYINETELALLRSVATEWLTAADNYKALNIAEHQLRTFHVESELDCRRKAAELQRRIAEYLDRHTSELQKYIAQN
jgi:hypothetical protein